MQHSLFNEPITIIDVDGDVVFYPHFYTQALSDQWLMALQSELDLKQENIILFGKKVLQPRLTAWVANSTVEYEYSGLNSIPQPWTDTALLMRSSLEQALGITFNGMLANYYRHGDDYMGWHRDNEASLGPKPVIASISLGVERRFDFRHRLTKDIKSIELSHGSLLVMKGDTQQHWEHRLPKQRQCPHPRLNLTFRHIT